MIPRPNLQQTGPQMAPFFGPDLPPGMLSLSTSPSSTASSGDSPNTSTTLTFQVAFTRESPMSLGDADVVPKIEELDEDASLGTKIESPPEDQRSREEQDADTTQTPNGTITRRPRGRPRKHPKTPPSATTKAPKGRSKTGCLTCRRRKKKCDETKPACLHCQKNNVHCEGYPPKDYWQSGKQRALKDRRVSLSRPPRELPMMVQGLENDVDWFFFDHFNMQLSRVLSLFTDKNNPFKELLLPMATTHPGLMHSILCLSGAHLVAREPSARFEDRQAHHFNRALQHLRTNVSKPPQVEGGEAVVIDDPTVAQVLVLCLRSICAGETNGEYRPHLDMAKHLVKTQPSRNPEFRAFLLEFFIYHDVSNSITALDRPSILMNEEFSLPDFVQPDAGMFLGVADRLFVSLSKTRVLRDRVRARREQGIKPVVDYMILKDAQAIDQSLREWDSHQPEGSPKRIMAYLYRQCAWLYLHRTIMPPVPNPQIHDAVEEGLHFLRNLPPDSSSMSVLLMPLYLLGLCAFAEEQRPDILKAFDDLQSYSNLGNIKHARRLIHKMWELMDAGDEGAWDFEKVQKQMGLDFLVT
ncbi:hypothetical protein, variant [Verruconis gallopava]|uniref:Zn(2)-C6 fungal-type domain-containing protein n=1 Tax=Verruconis gallopava TaxID=253628 RepID=A0A0D2AFF3_9PEZI|nr:hypothetical protein, variant [Verruconis gallopava]KIW05698.1 hypothetical protein, variant [Verruconis gallopava]